MYSTYKADIGRFTVCVTHSCIVKYSKFDWAVNKNRQTQLLYCKNIPFLLNPATCFGRTAIIRHIITKHTKERESVPKEA
jgi:hypothetical protein